MGVASPLYRPPLHRPPRLTLYVYVAREALRPTAFALLGLTAVLLTKNILGYSDLVINRGLGAAAVGQMLFFEAIPVAARMFPFAVLVGSLVALGRMGADREILVLESSGVAPSRLVWPVVSFSGVMAIVALLVSIYTTPWASRSLDTALEQISRFKPWAGIRAGIASEFGGWQLEAREVSPAGDSLRGVLLWMPDIGETIFARGGELRGTEAGEIRVTLTHGSVILPPGGGLRQLRFDSMTTTLPESDEPVTRTEKERLPGLPLVELAERAKEFRPTEADRLPRAALELHRRFALPSATLVFGLLAVPLFLTRRNYSRSSGGVLGLVCTIAYYGLVQLGEGLIQSAVVGVALGAWLPNLLLAALAVALVIRASKERALGKDFDRPRLSEWRWWPTREPREYRPRSFPLPRYIAGRYLQLALLSFSVLFVAYLLIDIMERLEWFARYRATGFEILRFYGARIPLLASRAVPMAVLVATSLTVSLLAVEGELVGIRACGIPAPRALMPVLLISGVVVPAYFLLNNVVVPRTNALADELKRTEIKAEFYRALEERKKAAVWYRSGSQVLEAALFDTDRGDARDLTIYELGENGLPKSRTDARAARHIGHGNWRLTSPSRIEILNGSLRRASPRRYAELGETLPAEVDTMHLSVAALAEEVKEVEESGYDATALRVDYHLKLADPFSCVVLPAVVLFFALGGPPFPGPAQTLLVSAILGVGYLMLAGVSASLGYGGAVPPAAGGWGPTLLFTWLAGFFGFRLWRRL
jgi:LPS export ABC transporter permease LptG/LPS export ABC transporter permease LptF